MHKVDARGSSWAISHRHTSFAGTVSIYRSARPQFGGFADLLGLPELATVFSPSSVSAGETVGAAAAAEDMMATNGRRQDRLAEASPHVERFPVVRFWEETIRIEEEILPEAHVAEPPSAAPDAGTLAVACEQGPTDLEVSDGQSVSVTWNGTKIGDLDLARSKGEQIVIRNARRHRGLGTGDVLKFQSSDDRISFERRSRAVRRILQKRSQIHNLIEYFDPAARLEPETLAEPVKDGELGTYELNPEQEEAFRHLWVHGPVGLLQGPPGTGKTRFIAAFAHYGLTRGRLRNVLVLSQSHEAVNTAAEGILEMSRRFGGAVELLRVGQHTKISPPLREFHSQAVQDRYRELFRAEAKERLVAPARHLGLRPDYVRSVVETESGVGAVVRQIEMCERDLALDDDDDALAAAEDRLATLRAALERRLAEEPFTYGLSPSDALGSLRDQVARAHGVTDLDARRRLLRLDELARDWIAVLGTRHRNLEEFLARSRNLVCGTCVGIGRQGIRVDQSVFDLVIIDEAARCTPGELAVGMQSGRRVLLVGDHRQLPPLLGHELLQEIVQRVGVRSRKSLEQSDFERAFSSEYGKAIARTLKRQYRMAPKIAALVHDTFYPGEELLTARGGPPEFYGRLTSPFDEEVTWIDTGSRLANVQRETRVGKSYTNRREARAVIELLRRLGRSRPFLDRVVPTLKGSEPLVGVICTYAPQARLVREMLVSSDVADDLRSLVKVDTVDSYQGKENRIIILTLVRSNPEQAMGFVRSANRANVALSRAMDRLIIVGSADMYSGARSPLDLVVTHFAERRRILRDVEVLGG
jgi:AAA domain